jgi:hypothetical protein
MKTFSIVLLVALLCGCKPKGTSWEYVEFEIPSDGCVIHLEIKDSEPKEWMTSKESSAEGILNLVGRYGWELTWVASNEKRFMVKRQRQATGHFFVTPFYKNANTDVILK